MSSFAVAGDTWSPMVANATAEKIDSDEFGGCRGEEGRTFEVRASAPSVRPWKDAEK